MIVPAKTKAIIPRQWQMTYKNRRHISQDNKPKNPEPNWKWKAPGPEWKYKAPKAQKTLQASGLFIFDFFCQCSRQSFTRRGNCKKKRMQNPCRTNHERYVEHYVNGRQSMQSRRNKQETKIWESLYPPPVGGFGFLRRARGPSPEWTEKRQAFKATGTEKTQEKC